MRICDWSSDVCSSDLLNRKGTSVIFSTHRMESVEEMCDSISLINKAKKVLEGKVQDIKSQYRSNTYEVRCAGTNGAAILNSQPNKFRVLSDETPRPDGETERASVRERVSTSVS